MIDILFRETQNEKVIHLYFKIQHCGDEIVIVFYLLYSTTFRLSF